MEKILCTLIAINLTQKAHSEFFAMLMKQATDDCVDEESLPEKTTQQQTSRILRSILSWDVAKENSWYGNKGKKAFSDLNICKLLCTSLIEHGKPSTTPATLKDIEKAAMSWLRQAAEPAAAQKNFDVPVGEDDDDEDSSESDNSSDSSDEDNDSGSYSKN
ncbi:uncharacterized protein LOC144167942 [Haemaphysalis longicornis]